MAVTGSGVLDGGGLAAHWKPNSRRAVINGYGRYLTFLDRQGWLDQEAGPDQRLCDGWLRLYIDELQKTVAPITAAGRIRNLVEALRVMVPGKDYPSLRRARQRLKSRARPIRNKKARMVPAEDLFVLGLRLMDEADTQPFPRQVWRSCTYRDGLCIVILACRGIRRANLAGMRLGQHLVKSGDQFMISFDESETKNHDPYQTTLDSCLSPLIERYLEIYQPILLNGHDNDHVWISSRGIPMSPESLYGKVVKHTKEAFGHALSPHLFRDAIVTSLGEKNPEHAWLSMYILHHQTPRTARKNYDHAKEFHAVNDFQATVLAMRQAAIKRPRREPLRRP
ncbi:MAG: hypothetical protein RLQ25_10875 [Alphaproteobacteria bacterium]